MYDGAPGFIMAFGCGFEMTTDAKVRAHQESVLKQEKQRSNETLMLIHIHRLRALPRVSCVLQLGRLMT